MPAIRNRKPSTERMHSRKGLEYQPIMESDGSVESIPNTDDTVRSLSTTNGFDMTYQTSRSCNSGKNRPCSYAGNRSSSSALRNNHNQQRPLSVAACMSKSSILVCNVRTKRSLSVQDVFQ